MRRLLLALLLVAATAACGSDQDPGVPAVPSAGGSVTTTTSRGLSPCPAGGPDATTPAAGCLDEDGKVLH